MSAIAAFKQQDWVKLLAQNNHPQQMMKKHVNPNVTFPFQDDFLVGSIHKGNAKAATPSTKEVVEIKDNEDDISILTTKTTSGAQLEVVVGSRVASGSNPVSGPTANSTQPGTTSVGLEDPASNGPASRAVGGPIGKQPTPIFPLHLREGGLPKQ
jgi:hypothetical protein